LASTATRRTLAATLRPLDQDRISFLKVARRHGSHGMHPRARLGAYDYGTFTAVRPLSRWQMLVGNPRPNRYLRRNPEAWGTVS
jgi:hypothetical protein